MAQTLKSAKKGDGLTNDITGNSLNDLSGCVDMRDLSGTIEVEPSSSRINAPDMTMDTLKKYYN